MIRWSFVVMLAYLGATPAVEDKNKTTDFEMTKDEKTLVEAINKERAKKKLPDLRPNALLFKVARAHSANMAKQGKMEHVLDGKDPGDRVLAAGYDYGKISENLAWSEAPGAPLTDVVKEWMESKTHRDNLLSDRITETGLGIAKNKKGEIYYTQLFARPRKVIKKKKER